MACGCSGTCHGANKVVQKFAKLAHAFLENRTGGLLLSSFPVGSWPLQVRMWA